MKPIIDAASVCCLLGITLPAVAQKKEGKKLLEPSIQELHLNPGKFDDRLVKINGTVSSVQKGGGKQGHRTNMDIRSGGLEIHIWALTGKRIEAQAGDRVLIVGKFEKRKRFLMGGVQEARINASTEYGKIEIVKGP